MLIPLRTDRPPKRRPVVTEALILVNVALYVFYLAGEYFKWFSIDQFLQWTYTQQGSVNALNLVTYQFVHDSESIWHLAFNMLFLWVFGCAVEDRLTRLGYLGFYLIGGAVAGLAHTMIDATPVIGASGSIAAVTGAFLALYPRSRIKILIIFFFIGILEIPALWMIGFFFAMDLLRATGDLLGGAGNQVAYAAHLAGYVYGFALGFALLALKILKRDDFDIFYLFTQAQRRRKFRAASRSKTGGLWEHASADTAKSLEKQAKKKPVLTEEQLKLATLRTEVNRLLEDHQLEEAATKYRALLNEFDNAMVSEPRQLDLGNQLYAMGDYKTAARAYELLLESYPGSSHGAEVRLMLGLIYTRELKQPQRARELIEKAKERLRDTSQKALAEQLLAELGT